MAPHLGKAILRAKWQRGWALMHAGKTTEGCDLLAGIKVNDLPTMGDAEQLDRTAGRIRSILDRLPEPQKTQDASVMEALITAARRGDREASDLLVFGDLEIVEGA